MKILIGTPVYQGGAFALDKFLINQKLIQQRTPYCELLLATCELGFVDELENLVKQYELRATVIPYEVIKPDYTKSRVWNIACGREAVRQYFLARPEFDGLLFLDADMTFDVSIIDIMERELSGYDVIFSGYRLRDSRIGLTGAGCLLMTRQILQKIKFRCYEFKNGTRITEDNVLEVDLFRQSARIKKGYFLAIDHYFNANEAKHIEPHKMGLWDQVTTHPLFRYCFIKAGILSHYNFSLNITLLMSKLRGKR
jgi:hypothetical protein